MWLIVPGLIVNKIIDSPLSNESFLIIQKQVGLRIREIRQSKHLSQEDFSFEVGLDRTYISSVERGLRNISIINLDKISHSFGMSLKEFFDPVPKNLNHNP